MLKALLETCVPHGTLVGLLVAVLFVDLSTDL